MAPSQVRVSSASSPANNHLRVPQTPLEKAHARRAAKKAKKEETKKRRLEALKKARDAKKKSSAK